MTTLEKLEELIYHGFKETDKRFDETNRRFQEIAQENEQRSREWDRRFQEALEEDKRRSQELDRRFQETSQNFQNIWKLFQENAARQKDTNRELKILVKEIRGVTDSLGRFAESMVKPAVVSLFRERGIVLTGQLPL